MEEPLKEEVKIEICEECGIEDELVGDYCVKCVAKQIIKKNAESSEDEQ